MNSKKSIILKLLLLLAVLVAVSGLVLLVLCLTKVIVFDNGFTFNTELFNSVKNEWWFRIVFVLIQIIITTLLCFVPATSMMFIIGGVALFGANWGTFLICFSGVILSSFLMYLLGRFGGYELIKKIVGKEDTEKATKLLKNKGSVFFPVMMGCAGFPDDALCCVAGIIKMNLWFYIISVILGRGIGVATIVFGISLIPFEKFNTFYDWFIFITVIIVWIIVIIYLGLKINNWLEKKKIENSVSSDAVQKKHAVDIYGRKKK